MFIQKKKCSMKIERRIYFTVLVLIVALFVIRIYNGVINTENAGALIQLSEQYRVGTVYDRDGEAILQGNGTGDRIKMQGSKEEQLALMPLIGSEIKDTYASRMTVRGMAPELYGSEDERLNLKGFLSPLRKRVGGSVQLTIDKELQTYIFDLLQNKGHDTGSVVVSNWETGEILAAVSMQPFEEGAVMISSVFNERFPPGSTVKVILAAAALSIDPELADYTYNCSPENHVFHTNEGDYRIDCAGGVSHGEMNLEKATAYSCNGYFLSLLQKLPKNKLENELKKWGFNTVVQYDDFDYWDHQFAGDSDIEYLLCAIGQGGCSMTPMGLHLTTNALLNSGELKEPHLIQAASSSPEKTMKERKRNKTYKVCEKNIADTIKETMLAVTTYGTGTHFYMPGFAAKTGTAQETNEKGELTGLHTIWTTGGLVSEETPYTVTVCLNNINEKARGGDAGQIAKEILQFMTGGEEQ